MLFLLAVCNNVDAQCSCSTGAGSGSFNCAETENALLRKGKLSIDNFIEYRKYKAFTSAEQDAFKAHNHSYININDALVNMLSLKYGLSDKWSIGAVLPYFSLRNNVNTNYLLSAEKDSALKYAQLQGFSDANVNASYFMNNKMNTCSFN